MSVAGSAPTAARSLLLPSLFVLWASAHAQPNPTSLATRPAAASLASDPAHVFARAGSLLVRDRSVQAELRLTDEQRQAVRKLADEIDGPLWPLRDLTPEKGGTKAAELLAKPDANLKAILRPGQWRRLDQLSLQAQGPSAILRPAVIAKLALSDAQQQRIRAIGEAVGEAMRKIQDLAREGKPGDSIEKATRRIRAEERDRVLAVLTDSQRAQWSAMPGRPFDFSRVRPPPFKAPEIGGAGAWVNAEPLTLAKLRGQVVALHFYTFGCGNCIRNYPHYKAWYDAYGGKGLTIVGVQTPETKGERDIEAVRKKAQDHGLKFPIVVDNDLANGDAWGNHIWPSVYLIDKAGYIRYWWYGELNYGGAKTEPLLRARIEELLNEGRSLPRHEQDDIEDD